MNKTFKSSFNGHREYCAKANGHSLYSFADQQNWKLLQSGFKLVEHMLHFALLQIPALLGIDCDGFNTY